jgi:hypothetical protein
VDIANRPGSDSGPLRRVLGGLFLASYLALAPSTVPDWRNDPTLRTVAVLPIGEPLASFDRR